jgi:hypothetical protein
MSRRPRKPAPKGFEQWAWLCNGGHAGDRHGSGKRANLFPLRGRRKAHDRFRSAWLRRENGERDKLRLRLAQQLLPKTATGASTQV